MYSKTEDEFSFNKNEFLTECKHENLKKYIENLFLRAEVWCLYYRRTQILRGTDTNNFSELIVRLLKDIPLERTKAFNSQLCDFIITGFEEYFTQRILDLIFNRVSKQVRDRYLIDTNDTCSIAIGFNYHGVPGSKCKK